MRLAARALALCALMLCLLMAAGPARAQGFVPDNSPDRMGYTGPDANLAAAVKYANQVWYSCQANKVIPAGSTSRILGMARSMTSKYNIMNLDMQAVRELVRTVWVARQMCPEAGQ